MSKHVIYNVNEIKNYINDLSKNIESETVLKWLNSNFYNYLINDYDRIKQVNIKKIDIEKAPLTIKKAIEYNENIVNIVLTKGLMRNIEHISHYLQSSTAPKNISRMNYLDALEHSKNWTMKLNSQKIDNALPSDLNIIAKLDNGYYIVQLETKNEFNKEGGDLNHCVLDYYDRYINNKNFAIWSIRNKNGKSNATVEVRVDGFKNIHIPQFKGRFNRGMIDRDAGRSFYKYLEDNYNTFYFSDMSAFGNLYYDKRFNKRIPLSLWEDGGEIEALNLDNQYINQLPTNLTVKGNLRIENTQICFLGEGLNVLGSIFASSSQLCVIDNTLNVEGIISVDETLLMSYPKEIKSKLRF